MKTWIVMLCIGLGFGLAIVIHCQPRKSAEVKIAHMSIPDSVEAMKSFEMAIDILLDKKRRLVHGKAIICNSTSLVNNTCLIAVLNAKSIRYIPLAETDVKLQTDFSKMVVLDIAAFEIKGRKIVIGIAIYFGNLGLEGYLLEFNFENGKIVHWEIVDEIIG